MQTGKALLTKYLLTTWSATPFGNTQSAHSREVQYSWGRSCGLALAGSWNSTTLSSDSWDMMSPTLDGCFIVCRQGRFERGGDQGAEVVKFERLLRDGQRQSKAHFPSNLSSSLHDATTAWSGAADLWDCNKLGSSCVLSK